MKTVLITGGSRGIGAEIVRRLKAEGYAVAFTYQKSEAAALALAEETGAFALRADAEKEAEIVASVAAAKAALGHIDVLVNNAGICRGSLLQDLEKADWDRIIAVNLTAAFLYAKAVLPEMIDRKAGRIINVTSIWGVVGASYEVAYSASKAGLIGFTKALAKEVGPSGITVNAVAPGVIDTDMNRNLSAEDMKALAEETPIPRIGTPRDVADAVSFLASDAASFITGENLNVGGGFSL